MTFSPFDHNYFLGYISQVTAQHVKIHFPSSVLLNGFTRHGEEFNGGLVGNFVVIESETYGFLGRIVELSLPEGERLSLNERAFQTNDFHPTGKIEILLSFDHFNPQNARRSLTASPSIGAKVFICSGGFVQQYLENFGVKDINTQSTFEIGTLVSNLSTKVSVTAQALFGRHCAVVGTTGSGKSYTVSKLIQELIQVGGKAILIDPTGEYSSICKSHHCVTTALATDSYLHYSKLTVGDLFMLFRPSGQVQQPILLEAIKSLKLANCLTTDPQFQFVENGDTITYTVKEKHVIVDNGCLIKRGQSIQAFKNAYYKYLGVIDDLANTSFDISKLVRQIELECAYENGDSWSTGRDERNYGFCTSLLMRISNILLNQNFKSILGFNKDSNTDLISTIEDFLNNTEHSLLRIGFEDVEYESQAREILANAIAKYLLNTARKGRFDNKVDKDKIPIVLFVDEAHQFINKSVKDEYFESLKLEAFDQIAKECRKYGLFLCISTQMPRDIPVGTLSQMGTFIVHRLINPFDKEAIANACNSANRNTLDFLPSLGEGEAILTGVDFPMPIIMKVDMPLKEPNSTTPTIGQMKLPVELEEQMKAQVESLLKMAEGNPVETNDNSR